MPLTWTDHSIVCITKNTKVPKRNQMELAAVPWEMAYLEQDLDCAVDRLTKFFTEVVNHHAPIKQYSNSKSSMVVVSQRALICNLTEE